MPEAGCASDVEVVDSACCCCPRAAIACEGGNGLTTGTGKLGMFLNGVARMKGPGVDARGGEEGGKADAIVVFIDLRARDGRGLMSLSGYAPARRGESTSIASSFSSVHGSVGFSSSPWPELLGLELRRRFFSGMATASSMTSSTRSAGSVFGTSSEVLCARVRLLVVPYADGPLFICSDVTSLGVLCSRAYAVSRLISSTFCKKGGRMIINTRPSAGKKTLVLTFPLALIPNRFARDTSCLR